MRNRFEAYLSRPKADTFFISVAAASLIAKVYRDNIMRKLAKQFPNYGFEKHKGYGTAMHMAAIKTFGPCEVHRKSFSPVRELLDRSFN